MLDYIKDEVTVILTVWKRSHIQKQLNCLLNQTKKPYQIWIYQNESHFDIKIPEETKSKFNISVIQSKDINFKFHGRFALPLLSDTEYTAIFDDDTIPGQRWLETCLSLSKKNNCIVGANGRSMKKGFDKADQQHMIGIGDGRPVEQETKVDFVGHCWFFKTEWCKYMWRDRPLSWDNGEDIHFAAACQIYGNIDCFVPKMTFSDMSTWGDLESHLGRDEHASWKRSDHASLRSELVKYWCKKGWTPLILKEIDPD